ncbi:MAG: Flp family type IVb pilin [Hyphomicrobiaceae bacterium]
MARTRCVKCASGATSIEYSLIAAFIGLSIIMAAASVGTEMQGPFEEATSGLQLRKQ